MLLEGVTVLDLTRAIAGPYCTRTLADLGAEVIKVEPPDGDLFRLGVPKVNGVALGFAQLNTGKQMLSVDLTQQAGLKIVLQLAEEVDVVIENYRPGVASRLGVGYSDIQEKNPGVVYCSISGYGQDGPAANRRAYAPIIHAELGLIDLNARERGTDPLPEAVSHADFAVGAQATSAILAALIHKLRSGEGQSIDVSMAETMLAMNEWTAAEVNETSGGQISPFQPGRAGMLKFHGGTWVQVPGNPTIWIFRLARALEKMDELNERGWFNSRDTQGCEREIMDLVQSWALAYTTIEAFEEALDSARLPLGRVQPLAETSRTDWALARKAFVDIDVNGEAVKVPGSPFRFSLGPVGPKSGSFRQGEDNRAVLKAKLGLDNEALEVLEAQGVLVGDHLAASSSRDDHGNL